MVIIGVHSETLAPATIGRVSSSQDKNRKTWNSKFKFTRILKLERVEDEFQRNPKKNRPTRPNPKNETAQQETRIMKIHRTYTSTALRGSQSK